MFDCGTKKSLTPVHLSKHTRITTLKSTVQFELLSELFFSTFLDALESCLKLVFDRKIGTVIHTECDYNHVQHHILQDRNPLQNETKSLPFMCEKTLFIQIQLGTKERKALLKCKSHQKEIYQSTK